MPPTSSRQHGASATPSPDVPTPTHAEQARTLMYLGRVGTLSTQSRKQPGFPFGSVMPYGLDAAGQPLFLISNMAMHTQNLQADARASLLVMQAPGSADVLGAARVTLIGEAAPLPEADLADARELYLKAYPNAKYWVDYDDFAFYRMSITDTYFVGGFGVMGWVTADDYRQASPDPLADAAEGIIRHMNGDHPDALALLARVHAKIEASEARMTAVDRLGFHVRLTTTEGMRGTRIAFRREVVNKREVREIFVEMVKQAR
ncbi:MAG: DUF2470 domain-containing protein [Acidobacteria bacterium]|nr:DUF2470 domain-containing protein [Acidobacteriota bacterium]